MDQINRVHDRVPINAKDREFNIRSFKERVTVDKELGVVSNESPRANKMTNWRSMDTPPRDLDNARREVDHKRDIERNSRDIDHKRGVERNSRDIDHKRDIERNSRDIDHRRDIDHKRGIERSRPATGRRPTDTKLTRTNESQMYNSGSDISQPRDRQPRGLLKHEILSNSSHAMADDKKRVTVVKITNDGSYISQKDAPEPVWVARSIKRTPMNTSDGSNASGSGYYQTESSSDQWQLPLVPGNVRKLRNIYGQPAR
jgi:hypothetical protein